VPPVLSGLLIRDALALRAAATCPSNGGYVLRLINPEGATLSEVMADLGVAKHTEPTTGGHPGHSDHVERTPDTIARLVAQVGPERMFVHQRVNDDRDVERANKRAFRGCNSKKN